MSTEAIVIMVVGAALLLAVVLMGLSLLKGQGDQRLLANGVPARATVLSVQDAKAKINGHPAALIRLDVRPPDGVNFEVLVQTPVTRTNALSLQPGRVVNVRFDRSHRAHTVIVPREG